MLPFFPDMRQQGTKGTLSPQSFLPGLMGGRNQHTMFNPLGDPFGPGGQFGPMGPMDPAQMLLGSLGKK